MKTITQKTIALIIVCVLMTRFLHAQDYFITFSGSGQSATVETVEVKNIDQQSTLSLNGTDTLHLTDVAGTGYLPSLNQGMIIYPNPANHYSRLEFYNSSAGSTSIEIYNFSGRLLIYKSFHLPAGSHIFSISGLPAGMYLVKLNTPINTYSQRLVSTAAQGLAPELQYEGISQSPQQVPFLKSISNVVAMQYNEGERLVIKAISGDYAHTKSLVPSESQNIDFEFIECVDGDGNHYGVVTIGELIWMDENLKTTHYRNGTPIEYPGTNHEAWQNNTTGAYAWYNNNANWKYIYGALYNWYAVDNSSGLCPENWTVSTHAQWQQTVDYAEAVGYQNDIEAVLGANNALRSCLRVNTPLGGDCVSMMHPRWEEDWTSLNHYGFDAFGFSGFPGGYRGNNYYSYIGGYGAFWSSTEFNLNFSYLWMLSFDNGLVYNEWNKKMLGFSVRCIRLNL
jgi:uncharacterized protein (TIGR02145 family)